MTTTPTPTPPSIWRKMAAAIFRPLLEFDPGKMLDTELVKAEAKYPVGTERYPAGPGATKRRPFTSGMFFKDTDLARGGFKAIAGIFPISSLTILRLRLSRKFYSKTIVPKSNQASADVINGVEKIIKDMGGTSVGYVNNLDPNLVFKGKELPHPHAIVFTVEMNKDEIATAPSYDSFYEIMEAYILLGKISQAVTYYLRDQGFAAYPGTNLGGASDYTALAEAAGLGAIGYHGLLIAPHAGARIRLNTIYTNIENLPKKKNEHLWIRDFCAECLNCVRKCPPKAIHSKPRPKSNGGAGMECISYKTCLDYFTEHWSCAICVKVCPFSVAGYDRIKKGFDQSRERKKLDAAGKETQSA